MSRRKFQKSNGIKLPFALTKELGLQETEHSGRGRRRPGDSAVADRKQKRKVRRAGKRHGEDFRHEDAANHSEEEGNRWNVRKLPDQEDFPKGRVETPSPRTSMLKKSRPSQTVESISKRARPEKASPSPSFSQDSSDSDRSRSSSPGLVLDPNSMSFQKHARDDDDEITALERRLGIRGNKKSKLGDDMLDFVLGNLEEETTGTIPKRDGQDWLKQKREKAMKGNKNSDSQLIDSDGSGYSEDLLSFEGDGGANYEDKDEDDVLSDIQDDFDESASEAEQLLDDDFDGFGSDDLDDVNVQAPPKKARENPYIAPVNPDVPVKKYIPPSLRERTDDDDLGLEQLVRLVQGHLNKLSEANLISILEEIEKVYRSNPRQDVTRVLIDRIFASFCVKSALQKTFVILHAAFLAAVYKVMGSDFGAELLTRLVERFDLELESSETGKEAYNLLNLLANLFNFGVVSSHIIYDHVRLLLSNFTENNTELLLCVIDASGPQLRSDDPSALKDIVQMMQNVSKDMEKAGQQASVRTKFMMERIVDLKNNKMKTANNVALMTGEHIKRMKKALGSLNSRTLKATEPLRISRADIANSEKVGKWWLIGASWKGNEPRRAKDLADVDVESRITAGETSDVEEDIDLLALAKQYRMNTDVRKSIFVAIMSANDCRDAQTRLLKLRLSTKQEQEIAKVLLRCARAEPAYNPYYALLAKSVCKDNKKIRMGFQFGLWDFFKRMGENEDDENSDAEDDESSVELFEIVNVAKLYAHLIFHDYLSIGILKTLNIGFLKEQATMFLEILLISIMTQPKVTDKELTRAFGKAADTPQIVKSLRYFVKKSVRKSDLVSEKDRLKVKEGCHVADATLRTVESAGDE